MNDLLKPREVAEILGCTYRTVLNYIAEGRLKAYKPPGYQQGDRGQWRVRRSDLEVFMSGGGI